MMDQNRILSRFSKVKSRGSGKYVARCPVHDDRSPSLSITFTSDRVLIHCFDGCHTEEILRAVNLTFRDLFVD